MREGWKNEILTAEERQVIKLQRFIEQEKLKAHHVATKIMEKQTDVELKREKARQEKERLKQEIKEKNKEL